MKRNENYILRDIAGQNALIPVGTKGINFNGIITLNEVGKLIWENMQEETDIDTLAKLLIDKYGIDAELAKSDVSKFIDSLREDGCIDE